MANGLELNYGSLCDVTEDVNALQEGKGKESVSMFTIWTALKKWIIMMSTQSMCAKVLTIHTITGVLRGLILQNRC